MTTPTKQASPRARSGDRSEHNPAIPTPRQLTPAPKMQRRPMLVVAAVAAVSLGGLAGVMAINSVSNAHDVVAVRQTVTRGESVTRDDLMTVRMGTDPAVKTIPASQLDSLVGKRAVLDLAAGGVVTPDQVTTDPLPTPGESIVGVSLTPAMLPANQLRNGDKVRVVVTPGQSGAVDGPNPETIPALVVGISAEANTGNTILNLQVPYGTAPRVAEIASTGKVAVVLDSQE